MNIDNCSKKKLESRVLKKHGLGLFAILTIVVILATGCAQIPLPFGQEEPVADASLQPAVADPVVEQPVKVESVKSIEEPTKMVSYDVITIGRTDPFMPYDEVKAYEEARSAAYAEAMAHNAKIEEIMKLKDTAVREADDISPYSFNLPVPPTGLASSEAAAAKITRTKVVGIMYNSTSPSAIINVDDKDYLVRPGDKIIGQEYTVLEINPSWITVNLGSNIYSASIGELFSRDELDSSQNDLYNLRNRFGGRKS